LDRGLRQIDIRADLERQTGDVLSHQTFGRYARWYRMRMAEREEIQLRMEVAIETAARLGLQMEAGVQAELLGTIYEAAHKGTLGDIGPYSAGRLAIAFADSGRKGRELGIKQEKLELDRHKLEMDEKKLQQVHAQAGKV